MSDGLHASVATVGHVTHDLYETGLKAGGGAFYSGLTYRALGHPTTLVTTLGEDFRCQNDLRGFEQRAKIGGHTTTFINDYRAGGQRQQLIQAVAPQVPPTRTTADLVHLAPIFGELQLGAWRDVVRRSLVALSIQGLTRSIGERIDDPIGSWLSGVAPAVNPDAHHVTSKVWSPRRAELSWINIVCFSDEDLQGQGRLGATLRREVRHGCYTMGDKGSFVWDGDASWWIGTYRTRAVDATGAGDVFAATFASGLVSGMGAEDAGRRAAAAASIVVEADGAAAIRRIPAELESRAATITSRAEGMPF